MKLLKPKDAAAYLGVSYNTLIRRNLPHYVVSSRGDRRYDQAVLDRWLLAHAPTADTEPTSSTPPNGAPARTATSAAPSFTVETRRNEDGTIDEILLMDGDRCYMHIEQMDKSDWFMGIYPGDIDDDQQFRIISAKRVRIQNYNDPVA